MAKAKDESKVKSTKQNGEDENSNKKQVTKSKATTVKKGGPKNGGIKEDTKATVNAAGQEEVAASKQSVKSKKQNGQEARLEAEKASDNTEKPLAKSGKRSAKAIQEAEEKQEKEERKAESQKLKADDQSPTPKQKQRTAEDRLKARGKNYREAVKLIDKNKSYPIKEAVKLAAEASKVKFDATVELHVRLSVDPKQADQNIRDTVVLPAGTGKSVRVAVFGSADDVAAAKKAGADLTASDEFLQQLDKGELNFDVLIATPAMMSKLGKYARVLGPKGLMPNPKSGTVTADVAKGVKEAKAGRVEYRVDSTGIVHVGIGKVSFGADKLFDNAKAMIASIKSNKPASVKGNYIMSAFTASTMGPSVKLDLSDLNNL